MTPWDFYDLIRDARLNTLAHQRHLAIYRMTDRAGGILLAITASGAAMAGWQSAPWWPLIAGAAALVSVVMPLLNLGAAIQEHTRLVGEYRRIESAADALLKRINAAGAYQPEHHAEAMVLMAQRRRIEESEPAIDIPLITARIVAMATQEARVAFPREWFPVQG